MLVLMLPPALLTNLGAQDSAKGATEVSRYCSQAAAYAQKHPAELFSATPKNADPGRDRWRKLQSRQQFQTDARNANSTAKVSLRDRHVIFVEAVFQNQFGDSTQAVDYCFRLDGTLAELHSELKSFHGGLRILRSMEYDDAGKQISRTMQSFDLDSGKSVAVPRDFWDFPPPIYRHVADLPFAKELR